MNDLREYNHSVDNLLARKAARSKPKSNMLSNILLATGITTACVSGLVNLFSVTADIKRNNQEAGKIHKEYNFGWKLKDYEMMNNSIVKAKELCSRTSIDPRDGDFLGSISVSAYEQAQEIARQTPFNTNRFFY